MLEIEKDNDYNGCPCQIPIVCAENLIDNQ